MVRAIVAAHAFALLMASCGDEGEDIDVHIPEREEQPITVQVEQEKPEITVEVPEQKTPEVKVIVPDQPTPEVNITLPAGEVQKSYYCACVKPWHLKTFLVTPNESQLLDVMHSGKCRVDPEAEPSVDKTVQQGEKTVPVHPGYKELYKSCR